MPQAPDAMRARWRDDSTALAHLSSHFTCHQGVLRPKLGYAPTPDDMDAVTYLVLEWDYGYEPTPASATTGGHGTPRTEGGIG